MVFLTTKEHKNAISMYVRNLKFTHLICDKSIVRHHKKLIQNRLQRQSNPLSSIGFI